MPFYVHHPLDFSEKIFFIQLRLKGITCGITTEAPRRKRSRSLPMPKIVDSSNVTECSNNQDGKKTNLGHSELKLISRHTQDNFPMQGTVKPRLLHRQQLHFP